MATSNAQEKRLKNYKRKTKQKHKEERKSLQFVALKRNNSALHPSQIQQEKHIKKQHEVTKRGNSSTKCWDKTQNDKDLQKGPDAAAEKRDVSGRNEALYVDKTAKVWEKNGKNWLE